MQKALLRKGLVFGIILLFVLTSITPGIIENKEIVKGKSIIENQNPRLRDPPPQQWNKTFPDYYNGRYIRQTTNGGYIITGQAESGFPLLLQTYSNGTEEWHRTFYNNYSNLQGTGWCVQEVSSGGYILTGELDWTEPSQSDIFTIKTDANGNLLWNEIYGSSADEDRGYCVREDPDGGFIVAGATALITKNGWQNWDMKILKYSNNGSLIWDINYGGQQDDVAYSLYITNDGGFVVAGYTDSFGTSSQDMILVKYDSSHNWQWQQLYDFGGEELTHSVQQTDDNGYILCGDKDLVKTDENGNMQWYYGFSGNIVGYQAEQTNDDGYIITGQDGSNLPLIKTDEDGNVQWTVYMINGYGQSVDQTNDGGYIVTGFYAHLILVKFGQSGGNIPPVAKFTWTPSNPNPGQTITFDASSSYDQDGYIGLYEWDWNNDGVYDETHHSSSATHSWSNAGNYPVTLRVTDNGGLTDTITKTVIIGDLIRLTPSNQDFGNIPFGSSSTDYSFTLKNIGTITATGTISLYGTNSDQFSITQGSGSFSLTAGQTKTIKVKFSPTTPGSKYATILAHGQNCNDATSSLTGRGVSSTADLKLFIEDALDPGATTIWKAPGDRVDIVCNVSNTGSTILLTFTLNLQINGVLPSGSNMGLVECFTRDNFSGITNENNITSSCSQNGNIFNVATNTIPGWLGVPVNGYKQFVFRLLIPTNAPSYTHTHIVIGTIIFNSGSVTSEWTYKVTTKATGIIITNRYLLYKKYGGTSEKNTEVQSLLQYLFVIADYGNQRFIVYDIDHYDASFKNWDQHYEKPSLNAVASQIDNYVKYWVGKQNGGDYLLIIGGDEVIPFYRVHDGTNYEINDDPLNAYDWVLNGTCKDYYISDYGYQTVIYQGHPQRWLATGRIVGLNASQMQSFIKNGVEKTPKDNGKTVVANGKLDDTNWNNVDFVVSSLENKGWNLVDKNIVTDKFGWNKQDLISALQKGPQIFEHSWHENYDCLATTYGTDPDWETFDASDINTVNTNGCISQNNPFIYLEGCRAGMVPSAQGIYSSYSIMLEFVKAGISGAVAAGGISYYQKDSDMKYGEDFANTFFDELTDTYGSTTTGTIGDTYTWTLEYHRQGSFPDEYDKKTSNEYVIYGVPWMTIRYPTSKVLEKPRGNNDYSIKIADPVSLGDGNYSRMVYVNISDYHVNSSGRFDYILINESWQKGSILKPQIPVFDTTINLSKDSYLLEVAPVENTSSDIGFYNLPCSNITPGSEGVFLTNDTDVVGYYPTVMYSYNLSNIRDYNRLCLYFAPIKTNPVTNDTILFHSMVFNVTYHLSKPIVLKEFTTGNSYNIGEPIGGKVDIENAGQETLTNLRLNLSIQNINNNLYLYRLSTPFTLTGGEATTISTTIDQIAPGGGGYLAKAQIIDADGTVLVSAHHVIAISTGMITNFTYPETITASNVAHFTIQFMNKNLSVVPATGVIHVYNSGCNLVAELISPSVYVAPGSSENISLVWNTTGVASGQYTITVKVDTDTERFSITPKTIAVNPGIYKSFLLGFITDKNETGNATTFKAGRLLYVNLETFSQYVFKSGEQLMVLKQNQLGFFGKWFIIGLFDTAILSETQSSASYPLRDRLKQLLALQTP